MTDQFTQSSSSSRFAKLFPTLARLAGSSKRAKRPDQHRPKKAALTPSLPTVNLLPPRLAADKARRNTKRTYVLIGVAMIAGTGVIWVGQAATIAFTTETLTAAQSKVADANFRLTEISATASFFDALDGRANAERNLLFGQVNHQAVTTLVQGALPAGATLSALDIKMIINGQLVGGSASEPASGVRNIAALCGPLSDPFSGAVVEPRACLSFSGTLPDRNLLARIWESLSNSELLYNVTVVQSSINATTGAVAFSGTALITAKAEVTPRTAPGITSSERAGQRERPGQADGSPVSPGSPAGTEEATAMAERTEGN
jgi:hypothetical protein